MSVEYDDKVTDRPLAAADNIDFAGVSQPRTSPELVCAAETPTFEAANSTAGMAPREGCDGELWRGEGLCQGPCLVVSDGRFSRCGLDSGTFCRTSSHRKQALTSTYVRQEF